MPDLRKHRGAHSKDEKLFHPNKIEALRLAVHDLSWLLTHKYAEKSALKLVGDRYRLNKRQRMAVMRSACSDQAAKHRLQNQQQLEEVRHQELWIDGFNLLITVESILSGGFIFIGRDGCFRDLASIHSTYRKVEETIPALKTIAIALHQLSVPQATWYFDSPVSNSGRLKTLIQQEFAGECWKVVLEQNPDKVLENSSEIVITSDSGILDKEIKWFNLNQFICATQDWQARLVEME